MGLFSEDKGPGQVIIKNVKLECTVCSHDEFKSRKAQLNTKVASFLKLDWVNKSAHCHICTNCGHIEWFMGQE